MLIYNYFMYKVGCFECNDLSMFKTEHFNIYMIHKVWQQTNEDKLNAGDKSAITRHEV